MKHAVENMQSQTTPNVVAENPLDKLDCKYLIIGKILDEKIFDWFTVRSKDFAKGINELAKVLNITQHPDPLITLRAVRKVITQRLTPERVERPDEFILTVSFHIFIKKKKM